MKSTARSIGEETVTVTDPPPATVGRVFAHTDVPVASARRVADWFARRLAGLEIETIRIRPPDPLAWYTRQAAVAYNHACRCRPGSDGARPTCNGGCGRRPLPRPRPPYPLARVLVRYPSFVPAPGVLRWLMVELPDGRVVPGASDDALALLARARVWWRLARGIEQ